LIATLCTLTLAALLPERAASATDVASTLRVHGLLDLGWHSDDEAIDANQFIVGDSPFSPYRLRLYFDGQASPQVQVFVQALLTEAGGARVDGAYALITPWEEKDLHVMAGKIAWPIGTWAPRTYSDKNPLIGVPLMYQYHTSLRWDDIPLTTDDLLAAAGAGATGPDYGSGVGSAGMPIVDDFGWDVGLVAQGSVRPIEFAFGATQSAPGWASPGEDANHGYTALGRLGFAPVPELRVGVSGARGAYLPKFFGPYLPAGKSEQDYPQQLVMADLEVQRGALEFRAEAANNEWKTPYTGTLGVQSGYAEARWTFNAGWWLASRAETERFSKVTGTAGTRTWDENVDRFENGIGYRISRNVLAKAVWQHSVMHEFEGTEPYDMYGAQLSVKF
jgi:hypothetical protein